MAGNLTNYAEGKILQHSVGAATWDAVTGYVGLFTVMPTDELVQTTNNVFTGEVSGNAYARQTATWTAPSYSGSATTISNSAAITFPTATPNGWGTVVAVGIFDKSSSSTDEANLIWWGPLTSGKVVAANETFQFGVGALSLSLD
jgi:hypothetical protein